MRISDWSSNLCSSDLRPSPKQSQHMQSPDVTKSGRVWSRPDHACRHRRRIETRGSFRRFRPTRRWTAPGATSSPAFRPSRALRERAQARSAKSLKWRSGAGLGLLGACFDESLKLGLLEAGDELAVHEERRRARDAHLADGLSIAGDLLGAGPAFVEHCRSLAGIDRLEGGLAVRGTEDVFGLGSSLRMNAAHEIDEPLDRLPLRLLCQPEALQRLAIG